MLRKLAPPPSQSFIAKPPISWVSTVSRARLGENMQWLILALKATTGCVLQAIWIERPPSTMLCFAFGPLAKPPSGITTGCCIST